MLVYLIRHAHALDGADDVARPLSQRGREQVRALARLLGAHDIFQPAAIWHSPLVRARETAELLTRHAGLEIRLIEMAGLVSEADPRVMARRILSEILQPRAEEVFNLVWDEIRRAGYEKSLNSGIVLTGGAALLDGIAEVAEQIFDLPIRRGCPADLGGLADHINSPVFATAAGLLRYGQRTQADDTARAGAIGWFAGRVRGLFKEFF